MKKTFVILCLTIAAAAILISFTRPKSVTVRAQPLRVAASIYPLAFLVQGVAGPDIDVITVTPSGMEPHDFQASPQDILSLRDMDLFFSNGAGVDSWAERLKVTFADRPVSTVEMADSLRKQGVTIRQAKVSEDGSLPDSLSQDPHFWQDPVIVQQEIGIIADALSTADNARAYLYRKNAKALAAQIDDLDKSYRSGLASCEIHDVIVSHDAFEYLAARYKINLIPISGVSPEQQPSARRLGELATLAKAKGIRVIFFETLVNPKLSQTLAEEVGAKAEVLNPIEGLTTEDHAAKKDYLVLMNDNLERLREAMRCK